MVVKLCHLKTVCFGASYMNFLSPNFTLSKMDNEATCS